MPALSCVPATAANDSYDVAEALEVARALWQRGERKDAIRWVRRAAEAADDADQTMRVVDLARAAAELEEVATVAPPDSRPTAIPSSVPPAPQSQTRVMATPSAPPRPSSLPPRPSTLPSRLSASPPRLSTLPPARTTTTPPPMPVRTLTPMPTPTPTPTPPRTQASSVSKPTPVPIAPRTSSLPTPLAAPVGPKETRVRVSLRTSLSDGDLLVVRMLPEGQPVPPGTREAHLVMVEATE
jgi:hypothetical protein